jgi:type II secretory pathway component PulK
MHIKTSNRDESGIAVLIVLLLLSFMLAVVMANSQALFQLKREVKLLDTRQKKRWAKLDATATNKPAALPAPIAK